MPKGTNKVLVRVIALFLLSLALSYCSSIDKLVAKRQAMVEGNRAYSWDEEWMELGTLIWHKEGNALYINPEKGWAKGTFGKIENLNNRYHLKPYYRFYVAEPNGKEKEVLLKMGYIQNEAFFSLSNCLEGCWSQKVLFEPGSRVIEETIVRGYEFENMEIPSKCYRVSAPY